MVTLDVKELENSEVGMEKEGFCRSVSCSPSMCGYLALSILLAQLTWLSFNKALSFLRIRKCVVFRICETAAFLLLILLLLLAHADDWWQCVEQSIP